MNIIIIEFGTYVPKFGFSQTSFFKNKLLLLFIKNAFNLLKYFKHKLLFIKESWNNAS